jgi:hypothetical protein
MYYGNRIPVTFFIVKGHHFNLAPEGLIHGAIKGHEFSGRQPMLSSRGQGADPFCPFFRFQVAITMHSQRVIPLVGKMDFEILVKHLQTAAGLEGQDIFHGRVHDAMDLEQLLTAYEV